MIIDLPDSYENMIGKLCNLSRNISLKPNVKFNKICIISRNDSLGN
jgi:hypothetical protein